MLPVVWWDWRTMEAIWSGITRSPASPGPSLTRWAEGEPPVPLEAADPSGQGTGRRSTGDRKRWRRAVFFGALFALASCGDGGGDAPPILSIPILDLTRVETFLVFGASLGDHLNPAWELITDGTDVAVGAATAGKVVRVELQPQGDYEIHTRSGGDWLVIYDHVSAPVVSVGDIVSPGDPLGLVGVGGPTAGRTELQINHGDEAVCPTDLGTPDFVAAHVVAAGVPGPSGLCLAATVVP